MGFLITNSEEGSWGFWRNGVGTAVCPDFRLEKLTGGLFNVLFCREMASHSKHESGEIYFCTVTCYRWLPLIEKTGTQSSIYRGFGFMAAEGCKLLGFVIMPNHFHALLYPLHSGTSINKLIGECKRFLAYDIVQRLKQADDQETLETLSRGVTRLELKKGKLHQVFRSSFDARLCYDQRMVEQKLDYIHHNPVSGKWNLVDDYADYPYSSAAFYERGAVPPASITHYKEL